MCLQNPVPYIFWNFDLAVVQQTDKVTLIYQHDNDFRQVRLNQSHPAKVVPSVHGDSVGHYEGDTLVIDTVGVKVGPYRMIDRFGTPYSEALHVVERYRSPRRGPRSRRGRVPKRNGRASGPVSIPTTGQRRVSSNSPWRIRASSPCRGRRRSPICARAHRMGGADLRGECRARLQVHLLLRQREASGRRNAGFLKPQGATSDPLCGRT